MEALNFSNSIPKPEVVISNVVEVVSSFKKTAWYADKIGQRFEVKPVRANVKGHVYKLHMFEVVDQNCLGDYIHPTDCKIILSEV